MKYICELCGLVYDEEKGLPKNGINPGTTFAELPEDFECPGCYSERTAFSPVGHKQTLTAPKVSDTAPIHAPKQASDR